MKKSMKVKMITAKGCKSCDEAKKLIEKAAEAEAMDYTLLEIDSKTKEATSLAITYSLNGVPAFVVNGHGFTGARHSLAKVRQAFKWGN